MYIFLFCQVQYIEPFVQGTIGAASNMTNSKQQEMLLDQAKSVTESALQFIYATKDCGGNPKVSTFIHIMENSLNIIVLTGCKHSP